MRIHTCVHRKKQVIALCVSLRAAQGVFYCSFPNSLYGFPSFFPISRFFRDLSSCLSDISIFRVIPVFLSDISIFPDHSGLLGFLFTALPVLHGEDRPAHRLLGRSYPRGRVHLPFWGQRPDKKELYGTDFSNGNPAPLEHIH